MRLNLLTEFFVELQLYAKSLQEQLEAITGGAAPANSSAAASGAATNFLFHFDVELADLDVLVPAGSKTHRALRLDLGTCHVRNRFAASADARLVHQRLAIGLAQLAIQAVHSSDEAARHAVMQQFDLAIDVDLVQPLRVSERAVRAAARQPMHVKIDVTPLRLVLDPERWRVLLDAVHLNLCELPADLVEEGDDAADSASDSDSASLSGDEAPALEAEAKKKKKQPKKKKKLKKKKKAEKASTDGESSPRSRLRDSRKRRRQRERQAREEREAREKPQPKPGTRKRAAHVNELDRDGMFESANDIVNEQPLSSDSLFEPVDDDSDSEHGDEPFDTMLVEIALQELSLAVAVERLHHENSDQSDMIGKSSLATFCVTHSLTSAAVLLLKISGDEWRVSDLLGAFVDRLCAASAHDECGRHDWFALDAQGGAERRAWRFVCQTSVSRAAGEQGGGRRAQAAL